MKAKKTTKTAWYEIVKSLNSLYGLGPYPYDFGGLKLTCGEHTEPFGLDMYDRDFLYELDCVKVFQSEKDRLHWHYVSFGFSDLYSELENPTNLSGRGFELTMRLKRDSEEETPPDWPVAIMTNLTECFFSSSFVPSKDGPIYSSVEITGSSSRNICAAVLVQDPELGVIKTETGTISMLQLYGFTADEDKILERCPTSDFVETISKVNPLFITDPYK
jgi:suppressor of fused